MLIEEIRYVSIECSEYNYSIFIDLILVSQSRLFNMGWKNWKLFRAII
jgi:hypothetical protein